MSLHDATKDILKKMKKQTKKDKKIKKKSKARNEINNGKYKITDERNSIIYDLYIERAFNWGELDDEEKEKLIQENWGEYKKKRYNSAIRYESDEHIFRDYTFNKINELLYMISKDNNHYGEEISKMLSVMMYILQLLITFDDEEDVFHHIKYYNNVIGMKELEEILLGELKNYRIKSKYTAEEMNLTEQEKRIINSDNGKMEFFRKRKYYETINMAFQHVIERIKQGLHIRSHNYFENLGNIMQEEFFRGKNFNQMELEQIKRDDFDKWMNSYVQNGPWTTSLETLLIKRAVMLNFSEIENEFNDNTRSFYLMNLLPKNKINFDLRVDENVRYETNFLGLYIAFIFSGNEFIDVESARSYMKNLLLNETINFSYLGFLKTLNGKGVNILTNQYLEKSLRNQSHINDSFNILYDLHGENKDIYQYLMDCSFLPNPHGKILLMGKTHYCLINNFFATMIFEFYKSTVPHNMNKEKHAISDHLYRVISKILSLNSNKKKNYINGISYLNVLSPYQFSKQDTVIDENNADEYNEMDIPVFRAMNYNNSSFSLFNDSIESRNEFETMFPDLRPGMSISGLLLVIFNTNIESLDSKIREHFNPYDVREDVFDAKFVNIQKTMYILIQTLDILCNMEVHTQKLISDHVNDLNRFYDNEQTLTQMLNFIYEKFNFTQGLEKNVNDLTALSPPDELTFSKVSTDSINEIILEDDDLITHETLEDIYDENMENNNQKEKENDEKEKQKKKDRKGKQPLGESDEEEYEEEDDEDTTNYFKENNASFLDFNIFDNIGSSSGVDYKNPIQNPTNHEYQNIDVQNPEFIPEFQFTDTGLNQSDNNTDNFFNIDDLFGPYQSSDTNEFFDTNQFFNIDNEFDFDGKKSSGRNKGKGKKHHIHNKHFNIKKKSKGKNDNNYIDEYPYNDEYFGPFLTTYFDIQKTFRPFLKYGNLELQMDYIKDEFTNDFNKLVRLFDSYKTKVESNLSPSAKKKYMY